MLVQGSCLTLSEHELHLVMCMLVYMPMLHLAAGAFFSFFTTPITKVGGRKLVMMLGGASFCIGAILCAFAQDLAMLIIGRICLGAGVGFANQVYLMLFW